MKQIIKSPFFSLERVVTRQLSITINLHRHFQPIKLHLVNCCHIKSLDLRPPVNVSRQNLKEAKIEGNVVAEHNLEARCH